MVMKQDICDFIQYLHQEKQTSENTEVSYERDLTKMSTYLKEHGVDAIDAITADNLSTYVLHLEDCGLKPATVSRSIASMKAFFHYEAMRKKICHDPSAMLKAPRIEKKERVALSREETDRLLAQPVVTSPKGLRDKAMLELLYSTSIRVSELISLQLSDVNLKEGYLICNDMHKERTIPLNMIVQEALENYLENARMILVKDEKSSWLFTNCTGGAMSRQGFWKLIKSYGKKAGIDSELTSHILRQTK